MSSVLIVDDNAAIRRSLRTWFNRQSGWEICGEAENGAIAVERVKSLAPDVVILDLSMPVMNGLEAARKIASIAPKTAMVLFTLHASQYLVRDAQNAGIRHVISKSDGPVKLLTVLERMIERSRGEAE